MGGGMGGRVDGWVDILKEIHIPTASSFHHFFSSRLSSPLWFWTGGTEC